MTGAVTADALVALGGAFLASGLVARVGRRIGLPTIPLFMAAGVALGPHTPGLALVKGEDELGLLAALGLVLLLFHLGLELSMDELVGGGRRLLGASAAYLGLNVGGGLAVGFGLGWGTKEALVLGGALGISSSAIVSKLLQELGRTARPESRLILGIIVVEDLFIALYLTGLQLVLGDGRTPAELAISASFLVVLVVVARRGGKVMRRVLLGGGSDELLMLTTLGLAVLVAGIAEEIGVSSAIGAFLVGLVVASSGLVHRVEPLVIPLRDAFAAVFFFAFGVSIDPGDAGRVAVPVAIALVMTFVCNGAAGLIAAKVNGFGVREAVAISSATGGRGELSLVLATMGVAAGLDERLAPFVAAYVLILAFAAPILAARSDAAAAFLERLLSRRGVQVPTPHG